MKAINQIINELVEKHGGVNAVIANRLSAKSPKPISPQRIGQYRRGEKTPGSDFVLIWKEVFDEDLTELVGRIETKVSRGTQKHTLAMKSTDNKEKDLSQVYQDLVESRSEYRLVPKILLDDYEIISKREAEERKKIVDAALQSKQDLINQLKSEIDSLRAKPQPVSVHAQQAK